MDQTKLQPFADDIVKVIQLEKFVLDKIKKIVGKDENAGYQHFLLFPTMFFKWLFLYDRLNSGLFGKRNLDSGLSNDLTDIIYYGDAFNLLLLELGSCVIVIC